MLETTVVAPAARLCAAVKAFELSDVGSFVEGELRSFRSWLELWWLVGSCGAATPPAYALSASAG